MRLAFAGTPQFAERALAALLKAGHDVALVLTQPDRPAGRGLRPVPSAVKRFAVEHGLALWQPEELKSPQHVERVRGLGADALVVAAYGLILPGPLLDSTRYGALNIHASLLPRWRGAAPVQRALLAGDSETGISIMQMDRAVDSGPVFVQQAIAIEPDDDAGSLQDRLAALGAQLIVQTLSQLQAGVAKARAQPDAGVSYAGKLSKRETILDWSLPASRLERAVRAFRPAPGALTHLAAEPIKIWRAHVVGAELEPGALLARGEELIVGCGEQALAVTELQRAGSRRMSAAEFLRGRSVGAGARFE